MDIPQIAQFAAALILVLALIILIAWALKKFFGGGASGRASQQGVRRRDRRLGIVEALPVGQRHRLLLLRRDDVEHLVLIGGNTEVVVESSIPYPETEAEISIRDAEPDFGPSEALRAPVEEEPEERREPGPLRDFARGGFGQAGLAPEDEPRQDYQTAFRSQADDDHAEPKRPGAFDRPPMRDRDDYYDEDNEEAGYEPAGRPGFDEQRADPAPRRRPGGNDERESPFAIGDDEDDRMRFRPESDVVYADEEPALSPHADDRDQYADERRGRYAGDEETDPVQSRILSRFLKKDED